MTAALEHPTLQRRRVLRPALQHRRSVGGTSDRRRRARRGWAGREGAGLAVLLVVLLVLAGAGLWRGTGGRWAVIETASMGRAVPVGSLIVTRPEPVEDLRVGDIVTYRPPGSKAMYTHRVVALKPGAATDTVTTAQVQGDSNGTPDPWPVSQSMLVGKVVAHWAGLGWLVRALPTLILALAVLGAATRRWVSPAWRSSVRVLGTCLVLAGTSLLLRPFVHPVLINTFTAPGTDVGAGPVRATVVSTGLLPTRITGAAGEHVDLLSGQIGTVTVAPPAAGGPAMIDGTAHLTGWWLAGVAGVWLLPLVWVLVVGLSPAAPPVAPEVHPSPGHSGPPGG